MNVADIQLTSPAWLWLYPVLLIAAYSWKSVTRGNRSNINSIDGELTATRVYHPLSHMARQHGQSASGAHGLFRGVLVWTAMGLLVLALAQPERVGRKLPDPLPQRDIVFIVDTSVSMTLRDYIVDNERVSRMTVVKGVLDEFVSGLRGSHLSVVVFGEHAYTYVPLTSDHEFVRSMIARMQTTMAGRFNAIGDGLALAVKNARDNNNRHTILVLLTDADRETGTVTSLNAASLAKEAGLPVYTIAIGAATETAEEKQAASLIYQPVNLDLLARMASDTGARSYRAGAALTLKDAIADIEKREKREVTQPAQFFREALYAWVLLPALLLIGLIPLSRIVARCRR